MAITATAAFTSNGNQSAGATLQGTLNGADILPGDVILVAVAADNAGTSGASSVTAPSDSQGHSYTVVFTQNRTAGSAANDGCTASIWQTRCTKLMANGVDTITANFSPNTTAKVFRVVVFRGMEQVTYASNAASGTGTTYNNGLTATSSMATGDLVFAIVASESNTTPTVDSDTTNGSWVSFGNNSGGTGGDATKMSLLIEYKIVTGTGTQTASGACTNSDWAFCFGQFTVPVSKSDTETGAQVDTESVDTGAQPSDDDTGAGIDDGIVLQTYSDDDPGSGADAGETVAVAIRDNVSRLYMVNYGSSGGIMPGTPTGSAKSTALPVGTNAGATWANMGAGLALLPGLIANSYLFGFIMLGQTAQQSSLVIGASSHPLAAATFGAGTWTIAMQVSEDLAAMNAFGCVSLYVWRPSTSAVVGYIYDSATALGTEWNIGSVSGQLWTVTGSDVTSQAGDVLVIEVWFRAIQDDALQHTASVIGGTSGAATTVGSTNATNYIEYLNGIPLGETVRTVEATTTNKLFTDDDTPTRVVANGRGGANGAGGNSTGLGGAGGGTVLANVGDVTFAGGSGANGTLGTGNQNGGGGGGGGGTASVGNDGGPGRTGATAVTGGGAGGDGGNSAGSLVGTAGTLPGGASGGGASTAVASGGAAGGLAGRVKFTWAPSATVHTFTSANGTETVPTGDTSVVIECWGASGFGGTAQANAGGGGGGGGGGYAKTTISDIVAGDVLLYMAGTSTGFDAVVYRTARVTVDAESSIADTLTDNDPASAADAGESLADALSDFDSLTSAEAESIFMELMGNLVTTGSLYMHL